MSDESEFDDPDLQSQFDRLCDEFLKSLQERTPLDYQKLVDENPDLAPKLESQLRLLESVFWAEIQSEPSDDAHYSTLIFDGNMTRELARRIACPNCGQGIQIVEEVDEATCNSCGSSIEVRQEDESRATAFEESPQTIGRFEILRQLGRGAFGVVFLARDPSLNRTVALKIPRQGFFLSQEEEQRFFREAQSAARLRHENIVRVHEVSILKSRPFIVSEFIKGVTLADIASAKTLDFRGIASMMVQVSDAVEHAHDHGVLHRDIKPSNILVDHERKPYVTDFGLARSEDTDITMTMDGAILGTPAFMSPEQAMGQQELVDYQSDVYSLGVVLYKLLCHELPFAGSRRMMLHQVVNKEPVCPTKFNRKIPRDLETITLKAIAREKSKRYGSARELKQELQRWLDGKPIKARPAGWLERTQQWCKRNPQEAAIVGLVSTFLLLFSIFFWWKYLTESDLRSVADKNAVRANLSKAESDDRLYQIYHQNGFDALDDNLKIKSAFWFGRALELKDEPEMRLRCGMVLDQAPKLAGVFPTSDQVASTEYSADGKFIAIGTKAGNVRVYDAVENSLVIDVNNEGVANYKLLFLNEGNWIAFRSSSSSVKIWDLNNDKVVDEIFMDSTISGIDAAPDGSRLLIAEQSEKLRLWDVSQKKVVKEKFFENLQIGITKLATENRLLVATRKPRSPDTVLRLIDLTNDREISTAEFKTQLFLDVSSDLTRFLSVNLQNQINVFQLSDGQPIGKPIESNNDLRDVRFSDDGKHVMGIVDYRMYRKWEIESGQVVGPGIFFDELIKNATLNKSRTLLAVTGNTGQVRFYSESKGIEVGSRLDQLANPSVIAFHPKLDQIAIENIDRVVRVWDLAATQSDHIRLKHDKAVREGIFIPNSDTCVTSSMDGGAYIWSTGQGEKIKTMKHDGPVLEMELSPDGKTIATISSDKTARLWSETGNAIGNPLPHPGPVVALAFSADGQRLVTGCKDGSIHCWSTEQSVEVKAPVPIYSVKHGDNEIRKVKVSNDNQTFASGAFDGGIKIWNLEDGKPAGKSLLHPVNFSDFVFANEDKTLVSVGGTKLVCSETSTSNRQQTLTLNGGIIHIHRFESSGIENFLTSDYSGSAHQFAMLNSQLEKTSAYQHPLLSRIGFSQSSKDGKLILSAGGTISGDSSRRNRGAVAIWSSTDGMILGPPIENKMYVRRARLDQDKKLVLSSGMDGIAKLIKLNSIPGNVEDLLRLLDVYYPSAGDNPSLMDPSEHIKNFLESKRAFPIKYKVEDRERENWNQLLDRK